MFYCDDGYDGIRSDFREELWFERLRDTPLSIVHDPLTRNVYIGLADGTLAVIEVTNNVTPDQKVVLIICGKNKRFLTVTILKFKFGV